MATARPHGDLGARAGRRGRARAASREPTDRLPPRRPHRRAHPRFRLPAQRPAHHRPRRSGSSWSARAASCGRGVPDDAAGPRRRHRSRLLPARDPSAGTAATSGSSPTAGADEWLDIAQAFAGRTRRRPAPRASSHERGGSAGGSRTRPASTATGRRRCRRCSSGGDIDVLTGDYLAELTMLILAREPDEGRADGLREDLPAPSRIGARDRDRAWSHHRHERGRTQPGGPGERGARARRQRRPGSPGGACRG